MIAKLLKIGLPVLFLGLCLGAYVQLRRANARLRPQIAAAQARSEQTVRLHGDNQRLQAMVERAKTNEGDALRAIHAEAEQARGEVAALEKQAAERREAKVAKDEAAREALVTNRDLTKGPVLLENCSNVGRGTPVDTFQTLVWAGLKGDDEQVANMIALDPKARALVATLLASLPESVREKYPTPEKMAALVWADMLGNVAAVQVLKQTAIDPQRVVLTVGRLSGKTVDLVMEPGPNGWQVATTDRKIFEQFKAKILGTSPATPEAKK
jgi:hypothetical protein